MIKRAEKKHKSPPRFGNGSYFFISGLVTILLVMLPLMTVTSLAVFHPFLPGNPLFPAQEWSEQAGAWAFTPGMARARYALNLVDVRIEDLEARMGTRHELAALTALETALDRASEEIGHLSEVQSPELMGRLEGLALRAESLLSRLSKIPGTYAAVVVALQSRLHSLGNRGAGRSQATRNEDGLRDFSDLVRVEMANGPLASGLMNLPGGLIPFPPGSPGAAHAFYGLAGRHRTLDCISCHTAGRYQGIRSTCAGCHEAVKPEAHFSGECAACHNPSSWQEVVFDHLAAGATECRSCHTKEVPSNHYSGQCSNCHDTRGWAGAVFNHSGYTNCLQCHGGNAPANHFSGQCAQCHSTTSWRGAAFNHSGYSDCQRCHAGDTPRNHFSGQCSQCHSTTGWQGASFNHAGFTDCLGCHAGDAPGNHFGGQCSQCHSQNTWRDASFNHSGQSDCIGCHLQDRPREHDSGQCSACHDTRKWDD